MKENGSSIQGLPKITYFDVRGRAEVIRLILEDQEVTYGEHRISLEEWPELKSSFFFEQLPVYEEDGSLLYQSNGIYRHLARKHSLYGSNEPERSRCDLLQETMVDMQNSLGGLYWNPDFEKLREAYEQNELTANLDRLQTLLQENNDGEEYFVGHGITYVDYIIWHYLDYVRPFALHVLERYPQLIGFKKRMESRPNIAAYLESDRRPKTLSVSMAPFGGTPETS